MSLLVLYTVFCCISGYGFQSIQPNIDSGNPLFLTPYIEGGKIQEGQAASRVRLPGTNITSHSGYLTVDKTFGSNLFFWYFPSEADPKNAPVVLWLQGGPGGSSMYGLFCENGAFYIGKNVTLTKRQYYWSKRFNVVYIDNPVGTGFSFTNDDKGYATDEVMVGLDLYSALLQFFQLFPYLQKNEFFITGESYAGKYIPAIGHMIYNGNSTKKINLKGVAIGDGSTDPVNMMDYSDYLYQIGLIDSNKKEKLKELENEVVKSIRNNDYKKAGHFRDIIFTMMYEDNINIYNYLQSVNINPCKYTSYLEMDLIRRSIHVGSNEFNNASKVYRFLQNDIMQSVKPWVEDLLENYRVMFYSGQLDVIVAYPLTENVLSKLNWTGSEDYRTAQRKEWMVDGELAGFYKRAKGLTEVLVRDAGHMVPQDQPKWALDLITRFVYNRFE